MGRVLNLYKAMRLNLISKNQDPTKLIISPAKPTDIDTSFNVINEPRPPGITQIIELSKNHRTPDSLRRRASRDNILLYKHNKRESLGGTKITVIKDIGEEKLSSMRRLASLGDLSSAEKFPSIQTTDTESKSKQLKS